MHDELTRLTRSLASDAARALDAPASPAAAFSWIAPLARGPGDRGIVLYRGGTPVAWAGRISAPIDSSGSAFAVVRSSFYTVLQATVARGQDRAIATAVLHADPPADRLSDPLDADVATRTDVDSFAVSIPSLVDSQLLGPDPGTTLTVDGVPLVTLRAATPTNDQARVSAAERVTSRGALVIAVAMLAFVVAEWRPRATMWWRRMLALATPLVALAIVPLNAFSNASRLFDPTYFFSPVGGPVHRERRRAWRDRSDRLACGARRGARAFPSAAAVAGAVRGGDHRHWGPRRVASGGGRYHAARGGRVALALGRLADCPRAGDDCVAGWSGRRRTQRHRLLRGLPRSYRSCWPSWQRRWRRSYGV